MGYKHKILFVEDDRDFYNLAVKALAGGGLEFEPALAMDRAACVRLLKTFQPDIIIADYHLPDIEGPETLRLARQSAPLAPFIALSGVVSDPKGLELEKLGAFKYLPKDRIGRLPVVAAGAVCRLAHTRPRILFIENDEADYKLELRSLDNEGLSCLPLRIQGMGGFPEALDRFSPNIIVTDYALPGFTALEVLELARQKAPLTQVIVVSGSVGEEKTIALFRAGAADYILKGNLHRLGLAARRIINVMRANIEREAMERNLREAVEARRVILDAVKAPFFVVDAGGTAVLGNPAAAAALGLPELEGAALAGAPGGYRAEVLEFVRNCAASDAPVRLEHKSGGATMKTHVYPVKTAGGERAQFAVLSLDITERKRAEEALRENEAKYKALIETTATGYVIIDTEGKVVDANAEYVRLTGHRELEEIRGRSVVEWTADHEKKRNEEAVAKCARDGYIRDLEIEYTDKRGKITPIEINATMLASGVTPQILTLCRDITGRRRAEEALRGSEARYRALFDGSRDALMTMDPALERFTSCNPAALRMFDAEDEAGFIAADPRRLSPELQPDGRRSDEKIREIRDAVLKDGFAFFEWTHCLPGGRILPVEVQLTSIKRKGGPVIFVAVRDITARKKAEEELRENSERITLLLDSAAEGIYGIDLEGKCTFCNAACLRLLGYTRPEELIGKNMHLQIHSKRPDGTLLPIEDCLIFQAFRKGTGTHVRDEVLWRRDGTSFPAEYWSCPQRRGGAVIGAVVSFLDDTERKKSAAERETLREQFLQSQKMEAVGRLAGGIAHDFNNILTAIKGYCSLVSKTLAPEAPALGDMKEIMAAADRATTLTRQLLAFSRKQIMAPKVVDLNRTLGDMAKMLQRIIGENVQLSTKLFPAACLARIDPSLIEHVIVNLAVNARDAVFKGGEITLETDILRPPDEFFSAHPGLARGQLVRVEVRDNGTGMSPEVKKHLFEPFFTTKPQGKGTGLGLPMVYGTVKQSGGEIEVESAPGKGSVFKLYFPLAETGTQEKTAVRPDAASKGGTETILLVEDEETLRRLGERLLRAYGYAVTSAAGGKEALEAADRLGKPVDLLLTDLMMLGMGGRELALELERRKLASRTLYMSGYTDEAVVKQGVLEPGIAFIYKPFTAEELALKLREVLDGPADQARA